jgi:hypothetical protein
VSRPAGADGAPGYRFRAEGPGRFLVAGFLSVWLVGWAAGESFALWLLWRALRSGIDRWTLLIAMVVWGSLWTLGGFLAVGEVLRCLWSEDRLETQGDQELVVASWMGPIRRCRRIPWKEIRLFEATVQGSQVGVLVAVLDERRVEITRLGSERQRLEAAGALNASLGPSYRSDHQPGATPCLPSQWQELTPPFSSPLLIPSTVLRRRQALVMVVVTAGVAAGLAAALAAAVAGGSRAGKTHPGLRLGVGVAAGRTVGMAAGDSPSGAAAPLCRPGARAG